MESSKIQSIKRTRLATKKRRQALRCRVISLKLDKSKLTVSRLDYLHKLFIEAKWFSNAMLSSDDIFNFNTKIDTVPVLNRDKVLEDRELTVLGSQMKQSLRDRMKQDVITLSKCKAQGVKVGRLKFKREVKSIPLKQNNKTFAVMGKGFIRLQGFRGKFKISGWHQVPAGAEIAQATLTRCGWDYFLKVTVFVKKTPRIKTGKAVGLDFGIKNNITTSDGETFNIQVPESQRLKRLQRGKSRKQKHSKNQYRIMMKIETAYEKQTNMKSDKKNKIVHYLTTKYDTIVCQDETIEEWRKGRFGKRVQHSMMGGIIADLKHKSATFIKVDRWFPSTQTCDVCGHRQKIGLNERIFKCTACGNTKDRDLHSALNILQEGLKHQCNVQGLGSLSLVNTPVELQSLPLRTTTFGQTKVLKQETTCKSCVATPNLW